MINKYQFSSIEVNGKTYTTDVIVNPKIVKDNWWRKQGHRLCLEDLEKVFKNKPRIIVIGTGQDGKMRVTNEVVDYVKKNKIDFIVKDTISAIDEYNKLEKDKENVVGCFHLTC